MYVIIAPVQIKPGSRDEFIEAIVGDAIGSVNHEPGCRRFDVIQDADDENRVWLYEIYDDEAAFKAHLETPHFIKFRDATADIIVDGLQGAALGSTNIWPTDEDWQ